MNIIDALWKKAADLPDSIALRCGDRHISYAELIASVEMLSAQLKKLAGDNEPIGIQASRSPEPIIAILAVMKSGCPYVPLDPAHPLARRREIVKSLCLRMIFTTSHSDADPSEYGDPGSFKKVFSEEGLILYKNDQAYITPQYNNLAYILHTSGSTGKPKGVAMSMAAVTPLINWQIETSHLLTAEDPVTLHFAPLGFDVSFQEIFSTLCAGHCLFIAQEEDREDPRRLLRLIAREKIVRIFIPPAIFLRLAEAADLGEAAQLPLREVIVAGEQLRISPSIVHFFEAMPRCRLVNQYGPTETHVITANILTDHPSDWPASPNIGEVLPWVRLLIVDESGDEAPSGKPGEIWAGGVSIAAGYLGDPSLTTVRFLNRGTERYYRTGDLGRRLECGKIEYLGRIDRQVKIRGVRVELEEVENVLRTYPDVAAAVAGVNTDPAGGNNLFAAVKLSHASSKKPDTADNIREYMKSRLPEHYVPLTLVVLEDIPLSPNGKVDIQKLKQLVEDKPANKTSSFNSQTEEILAAIWQDALGRDSFDRASNFFDVGGHSLALAMVQAALRKNLGIDLPITLLFEKPTIKDLAQLVSGQIEKLPPSPLSSRHTTEKQDMAIIGIACRFPDANNIDEFWLNLSQGKESIIRHSVDSEGNVRASAPLKNIDLFDAEFFGIPAKEATYMDPQHRIFLECAWECLEDGGYASEDTNRRIGVFAGGGLPTYLINNVHPSVSARTDRGFLETMEDLNVMMGGDKDYLPSRVAYKLNLQGPAINIQTACSTSLVAIHMACKAIQNGDCDLALAGAASILVPQSVGHAHEPGMVFSADGRCCPFDAAAQGTVFGSGVGIILIKPLAQALSDNDLIHAVIKGTSINNDGGHKVGFSAPSVRGQEAVIRAALRDAGTEAETLGYVECHGTATALGDAVEIEALRRAADTPGAPPCFIGSVKSNIGHLGWAAGMAGMVKTVAALKNGKIPPTLNFQSPNPNIPLSGSRFSVAQRLESWPGIPGPRRAGLSSFGLGGTNAHIVLEEAPQQTDRAIGSDRCSHLVVLSAPSGVALRARAAQLAEHLKATDDEMDSVSYTANTGHHYAAERLAIWADSRVKLIQGLQQPSCLSVPKRGNIRKLAFLYSGYGPHYKGMGKALFETQPIFRSTLQECDKVLHDFNGQSVLSCIYGDTGNDFDFSTGQPAFFAFQAALSRMWMSFGIVPAGVIGHSLGEFAAAWQAGVFSLEDALRATAVRGRLLDSLVKDGQGGLTISVKASLQKIWKLASHIIANLDVASENSPESTVFSGLESHVRSLEQVLEQAGIKTKILNIPVAAHSRAMDRIVPELESFISTLKLSPPSLPIISNVSGAFIRDEIATFAYWGRHLRQKVRFYEGMVSLAAEGFDAFLEICPKPALTDLAEECLPNHNAQYFFSLGAENDWTQIHETLGQMYVRGLNPDWRGVHAGSNQARAHLPPYPFQKSSYWIGTPDSACESPTQIVEGYRVEWTLLSDSTAASAEKNGPWIIITPSLEAGEATRRELEKQGRTVILAEAKLGSVFQEKTKNQYTFSPVDRVQFDKLFSIVSMPEGIVYIPCRVGGRDAIPANKMMEVLAGECMAITNLAATASTLQTARAVSFNILTHSFPVLDPSAAGLDLDLASACLAGLTRTLGIENPEMNFRIVHYAADEDISLAVNEILGAGKEDRLAIAHGTRYGARLKSHTFKGNGQAFPTQGTCLITGGMGGLGLRTVAWVASLGVKRIVLSFRSEPAPEALQIIHNLSAGDIEILLQRCDISNPNDIVDLLLFSDTQKMPLTWIIHSAGRLDDAPAIDMTIDKFCSAFGPKVAGTWNLHVKSQELCRHLQRFDVYSSVVGTCGNPGQANHAAANAFLDALILVRRAAGLPGMSIAWGAWGGIGTLAKFPHIADKVKAHGFILIPGEGAEDIFGQVMAVSSPHIIYAPVSWPTFLECNSLQQNPFFETLRSQGDKGKKLRPSVLDASPGERITIVTLYLQAITARILGMPQSKFRDCPLNTPFANFGLDSLSSLQVRNILQSELGTRLPPSLLFRHNNVQSLAEKILEECLRVTPVPDAGDNQSVETVYAPLSPANDRRFISRQQKRWLRLVGIDYGRLLVPIVFYTQLDKALFRQALTTVVQRHEILRWTFDGEQAIVLNIARVIPESEELFFDLSDLPPHEQSQALSSLAQSARRNMPDPTKSVPWKIACVDISPEYFIILLSVQHLEFDGTSISVFVNDLRECYAATLEKRPALLGELVPYSAYVDWQELYERKNIANDRAFFQGLYSGVTSPTSLPGHPGFNPTTSAISYCHSVDIKGVSMADIQIAAQGERISPFSIMATAYALMLAEITSDNDLLIGSIVAGRPAAEFSATIGPFVAPFPIPVSVNARTPMRTAKAWHAAIEAINERCAYPVADLTEHVDAFLGLPKETYFTDTFIMYNNYAKEEQHSGLRAEVIECLAPVVSPLFTATDNRFLPEIAGLFLIIDIWDNQPRFNFWHHVDRFSEEQIALWAERYLQILSEITLGPA